MPLRGPGDAWATLVTRFLARQAAATSFEDLALNDLRLALLVLSTRRCMLVIKKKKKKLTCPR